MLRTTCAAVDRLRRREPRPRRPARATPAPPAISVQQQSALTMQLTSSTGTHWSWTIVDAASAVVATATDNPADGHAPGGGRLPRAAGRHRRRPRGCREPPTRRRRSTSTPSRSRTSAPPSSPAPRPVLRHLGRRADGLDVDLPRRHVRRAGAAGPDAAGRDLHGRPGGHQPRGQQHRHPAGRRQRPAAADPERPVEPGGDRRARAVRRQPLDRPQPGRARRYSWDLDGDGQLRRRRRRAPDGELPDAGPLPRRRPGQRRPRRHQHRAGARSRCWSTGAVGEFTNDPVQPVIGATVTLLGDRHGRRRHRHQDRLGPRRRRRRSTTPPGPWARWSFDVAGRHRVAVRADRRPRRRDRRVPHDRRDGPRPARTDRAAEGRVHRSVAPRARRRPRRIPNAPAPSSARTALLAPFPVVRIRGLFYRGSVRISLLRVQAPPGATIRVSCRGGSCAAKRPDVRVKAARAPLRVRSLRAAPAARSGR